jgi:hypothetical protein
MYPHGETVTILRNGTYGTDEYGTPLPATPTPEDWEGVAVAPGDTRENLDRQATVEVTFTLYGDPIDLDEADQIVVRGDTYEIEGRPRRWTSPFTGWSGLEVAVRAAG